MPPTPVTILLPPSEGKAEGGGGPGWDPAGGRFGSLAPERLVVGRALAAAVQDPSAAQLLGVGGTHLARAVAADLALLGAPTLPAHERYRGVVHTHLDPATLRPAAATRAAAEVVFVSGLLGLVGWSDPVPDYRIKMGARLPPLGRLSRWWRPAIAAQLRPLLGEHLVVDLLPTEHADAWDHDGPERLRVRFVDLTPSGGVRRASGHAAKAVKGRLARHLLSRRGDPRRSLAGFTADGWTFDATSSTLRPRTGRCGEAVFTRTT